MSESCLARSRRVTGLAVGVEVAVGVGVAVAVAVAVGVALGAGEAVGVYVPAGPNGVLVGPGLAAGGVSKGSTPQADRISPREAVAPSFRKSRRVMLGRDGDRVLIGV